jgi:uncharacterized repeat protein (TIGR01451 family)
LLVSNTGGLAAGLVTVTDTVPALTNYVGGSISATRGISNVSLPLLTWTVSPFNAHDLVTLTFAVNVTAPLTNGTRITNTAYVSTTGQFTSSTVSAVVSATHTLSVAKSARTTVQPGDLITYTIAYTYTGNEQAADVTISDTTPAQTTFYTVTPAAGVTPPVGQPGTVRWSLGTLVPGGPGTSGTMTMVVQLGTPAISGNLVNTVLITDASGTANNTRSFTTTVQSSHTLSVTKSAPPLVVAGDLLTYTIYYTATGNEPAPGARISDTVPANTTFTSCSANPVVACGGPAVNGTGVVSWTLGNLNPNPTVSGMVTLVVTVGNPTSPPRDWTIDNSVFISDTLGKSDADTTATPVSLPRITKTMADVNGGSLQPSDTVCYTLTVANVGNVRVNPVYVTDTLPANTTYQGYYNFGGGNPPGTISTNTLQLLWNGINLSSGSAASLSFTVTVNSPLTNGTSVVNQAQASGTWNLPGPDSQNPVIDSNQVSMTVQSSHTLSVTKSTTSTVSAGSLLTYTIAYTVAGNAPALDATISDTTPISTTFYAVTPAANVTPSVGGTGPVIWRLGDLSPTLASTVTGVVTMVVQVNGGVPSGSAISNTVSITDASGGIQNTSGITTPVALLLIDRWLVFSIPSKVIGMATDPALSAKADRAGLPIPDERFGIQPSTHRRAFGRKRGRLPADADTRG